MKYAWVENDTIRDVCQADDPYAVYTPDVAAYYDTLVPDEVQNGWINVDGTWEAPPAPPPPEPVPPPPTPDEVLYQQIVDATQKRLDDFAKTRGYDGILSAVTYANSPTEKFATEGTYCLNQRDATWTALITMFDEVQAGTRPKPTSYADIEPDLPPLVWPN